jgi:hypothetical protein
MANPNPIWQSPLDIGTFNNNTELNTNLVATPVPPAIGMTYQLYNSSLPAGLVLTSTGLLAGTLYTAYTNNQYIFTVQATDNLGNSSLRTFTITIIITPEQPVWNTPSGTIGTYPSGIPSIFQFSATAMLPASTLTYSLLSGALPTGFSISTSGLMTGTPTTALIGNTYNFAVRATDNLQNIRDRSFSISISGSARPTLTSSAGSLLDTIDSVWVDFFVEYSNPISSNPVVISVIQGDLPPGLEISDAGEIRGYPAAPTVAITLPQINSSITQTSSTGNVITCLSTLSFTVGRPIVFTGTSFGTLISGYTYYVNSIVSPTTFTVSTTQFGSDVIVTNDSGFMAAVLPPTSAGQPTITTYNFVIGLASPNGSDSNNYSITVINQNTPVSQGGPGFPPNTRVPVIENAQPPSYNIPATDPYYGYYLPVTSPSNQANLGTFQSGDYFAFKVIGVDFDDNVLQYVYTNLPNGLTGDVNTGWISGTPVINVQSLNQYNFTVAVYKENNPSIISAYYNFGMEIANGVNGSVVWDTDSNLGTIFNGVLSTLEISATADVELQYTIVSGALPANLELLPNGQITGYVAFQPTTEFLSVGDTTDFTFTIQASSPQYPAVTSTQTFTLTVLQQFGQPTDTLYMKCTPSIEDRLKIESLLTDTTIIPTDLLYRPNDQYFGKATEVVYEHAYGIYASTLPQYLQAVTQNHYWRNITLGQLNTAVAKDSNGNVIYEVVYSEIIDNLVEPTYYVVNSAFLITGQTYTIMNPGSTDFTTAGAPDSNRGTVFVATGAAVGTGTAGTLVAETSVSSAIVWPQPVDLQLGPWYTSSTSIFASYEDVLNQDYFTSLTPGYADVFYPNSLPNMRDQVAEVLGQVYDSNLLPLWMTSQQADGSTTGFVPAWVIAYTLPGQSSTVMNNIQTMWPYTLNQINFRIDRFSVNKSNTYNYNSDFLPPTWTTLPSATPVPNPLDSDDFYVLFPTQTILPDKTQY